MKEARGLHYSLHNCNINSNLILKEFILLKLSSILLLCLDNKEMSTNRIKDFAFLG